MSKIKQVLNSVPKRLAAGFGLAAAVLVPIGIFAWGPDREVFTFDKPATYITFNSIKDNPDVGDERNFLRLSSQTGSGWSPWSDVAEMEPGKSYYARIFVHNDAASNLNLVATNVHASLNMPIKDTTWGHQFEVNGFVMADNAKPNKIWDNMVLKSDYLFHTKIVSAKYYNNIRSEANSGGFDLDANSLTSAGGAMLGYEQMDGKIPGCYKYAGYVLVKFEPVFKENFTPKYDVEKQVDKTTAKAGDTITYTINVKNTGNQNLYNVVIDDKLPAMYSEAHLASATMSEVSGNTEKGKITGDIIKDGKINISKLAVGQTATIKISYKIADNSKLTCGENKIINTVASSTDQTKTEDNTNNNTVTTTVAKDCEPEKPVEKPSYDLVKTVNKTSAKAGETLDYTLTFKNTGNVALTNVVITDKLPSAVELKGDVKTEGANASGNLFGEGLKLDKVEAGKVVTVKFTVTVKTDKLECGDNKIINSAYATTDQTKNTGNNGGSDNGNNNGGNTNTGDNGDQDKSNNTVTTTVAKDCEPNTPNTPNTPNNPNNPTTPNNPSTPNNPTTPANPSKGTTTTVTTPSSPTVIAQTGATETVLSMIGFGALIAATTAYIRSRKVANNR